MMKYLSILALTVALAGVGCASRTTTATTAPAGPVQAATTEPGVIPSGTTFAVRTNESINTKEAGKTFSAQVAQDVTDQSGKLLIPSGSAAELVVLQTSSGGAVGTRTMELGLRSINVKGKRYDVTTGGVTQEGEAGLGRNRRTAEMVGGGAALGTLIGAVAGGGKGAAVGAAVGAGAGAVAQVLTRGDEVRVPAESVLTFRLSEPLRLQS